MNRTHLTFVLATVLIGTSVAPRSVMAHESAAALPPSDAGRPMSQFWSGLGVYTSTVLVGGMGVVMAAASADGGGWAQAAGFTGMGIMFAAPALAGATVCAVGRRSPHHSGGCGAPIAAAYGGLLAATGLFMLANEAPASGLGWAGGGLGWAAVLGTLILPPAAAVAGWELFKTPASPPGRREAHSREPLRPHTRAGWLTPGTLAVPLLAGSF